MIVGCVTAAVIDAVSRSMEKSVTMVFQTTDSVNSVRFLRSLKISVPTIYYVDCIYIIRALKKDASRYKKNMLTTYYIYEIHVDPYFGNTSNSSISTYTNCKKTSLKDNGCVLALK